MTDEERKGGFVISKETTISVGVMLLVVSGVAWNVKSSTDVAHKIDMLRVTNANAQEMVRADLAGVRREVESLRTFQQERVTREEFRNYMEKMKALNPNIKMPER